MDRTGVHFKVIPAGQNLSLLTETENSILKTYSTDSISGSYKIYLNGTLYKTYLKLMEFQNVKYVLEMDWKTEKLKFTLTKDYFPFLLLLEESGREASKE